MSYYNTEVYNDEALNEIERKLIAMYDLAIEDASNKGYIVCDMFGFGDEEEDTIIDKMQREIAEKTIDAVVEYMKSQRMEVIVSWLDERAE